MEGFEGSIHIKVQDGWVDSRVPEVAKYLHQMSGGRLELLVRCNQRTRQAECYDIFETIPGGQKVWVTRFGLKEAEIIISELMRSDRQAPGHVPVGALVKAHNEAQRQAVIDEGVDVTLEFADRVEGVKRDQFGDGKDFHGQAGWDGPKEG